MKFILLTASFLLFLMSLQAHAENGRCKWDEIGYPAGQNKHSSSPSPCHYHTHGTNIENGIEMITIRNYQFPSKKKLKAELNTMKHIMKTENSKCYDNVYIYMRLPSHVVAESLSHSRSHIEYSFGKHAAKLAAQATSLIYVYCGKDAYETWDRAKKYNYNQPSVNYWTPTHFYKNEYSTSEIYKFDSSKLKTITDKSAKEEKAKKLQPLKDDCKDLGFTENTEAMGNCILKLMELKQSANLSGQSQSSDDTSVSEWLGIANDGIYMMNDSSSSSQTCFKTGEVKQAFNKICEYKCGLTTYTTNLGSGVGICPSTIQR